MATDHRGNPMHAGKRTDDEIHAKRTLRPTPRLTSALGALYGTSTYRDPDTHQARMVNQDTIDSYRNDRDTLFIKETMRYFGGGSTDQLRSGVEGMQKDIRTAISANRDPEYMDALNDHGQSY